jgi:hypothetical protein
MARKLTFATATLIIAGSLYIVVIGLSATVISEGGETFTYRRGAPAALVPMLGAALILLGELAALNALRWVGLLLISAFALVLFFSLGVFYLPAAVILLMCFLQRAHVQ